MPGGLGHDPRLWQRDDVAVFMRYCEREFDLDKIDMDKFQMNGEHSIHRDFDYTHLRLMYPLRKYYFATTYASYDIHFLINPVKQTP